MQPSVRLHSALLACAMAALVPAAVFAASAAVDQATRLGDSDPLAALAILQIADEAGDVEASAVLASTLFFAPPPRTNRARACAIAQRLADGGRGDGWALLASCQLAGTLPAANRLEAARASARRAIALGAAQGGVALFTAYVADPRFVARDADKAPSLTPELRSVQAEAWTGLSLALDEGSAMAAEFALAALVATAAPGNLQRVVEIAERAPAAARRFADAAALARQYLALGGTHASIQQMPQVQRAALSAATLGLWRDGGAGCDSLSLDRIAAQAPEAEPTYLPVRLGPLARAYLVSGRWQERWHFSGCGREVPVDIAFTADGSGAAVFEAAVAPRSIVRRAP